MNRRSFFKGLTALVALVQLPALAPAKATGYRPLLFGRVLNASAVEESTHDLTYRVHAGSVQSIEAVYDRGMELIIDGDDATADALRLAEIRPGHARTCVACGTFRLGTSPVSPVTADATGDRVTQRIMDVSELAGACPAARRDLLSYNGLLAHNG